MHLVGVIRGTICEREITKEAETAIEMVGESTIYGIYDIIEVRGGPHEVFRPREGGLTRIRCFRVVPCRAVACRRQNSKIL